MSERNAEPLPHRVLDGLMNSLDRGGCVDDDAALRLTPRDLEKPVAQLAVKFEPHALEAVLGAPALVRPRKAGFRRQVEDEGEVGYKLVCQDAVELHQLALRDAAGMALIGERRIGETVGDDPPPRLKRRPHRLD